MAAANEVEINVVAKSDGASLGGVERDLEQHLVKPARDAAAKMESAFSGVDDKIAGQFSGLASKVRPDLDRLASSIPDSIGAGVDKIDFSDIGNNISAGLSSLAGVGGAIGGAALAIGSQFGDDIATGFTRGFSANRSRIELGLKTGLEGANLEAAGKAGGAAYAAGFGDSISELKFAAAALSKELGDVAGSFDLGQVTKESATLKQLFGIELPAQINITRRLLANDLVRDASEGLGLVFDLAQRLPTSFEDGLDVIEEFTPVFAKLGLGGAQAFRFIGDAIESGIFVNADRAAELLEEFNVRLQETDTLREVFPKLGIGFEEAQQKLANGRGVEVLEEVTAALLAIEDPAQRDAIAIEIFGTAIESAADPQRALELLNQASALGEITTNLEDATASLEESHKGWTRLGRGIEGASARVAGWLSFAIDANLDSVGSSADWLGGRWVNLAIHTDLVADSQDNVNKTMSRGIKEAEGSAAAWAAADASMMSFGNTTEGAATKVFGLVDATGDLRGAFSDFWSFDHDANMRNIADSVEDVRAAMLDAGNEAIVMGDSINTTTDAGVALERAMEGLNADLQTAIANYVDGSGTAEQLAVASARVEQGFNGAAAGARLAAGDVAVLRGKYLEIPPQVLTEIIARDGASSTLAQISKIISAIPRNIFVTVHGRKVNFGGFTDQFATGGVSSGGPAFVGERGVEIIDLPPGAQVHPEANSQQRLGEVGNGMSVIVNQYIQGSVHAERELVRLVRDDALGGGFADVFS